MEPISGRTRDIEDRHVAPAATVPSRTIRTRARVTLPVGGRASILFLAANPQDSTPIALDEEARDIEAMLRASKYRDALDFQTRWAVRLGDLQQELLEVQPAILHFSGHGSGASGLVLAGGAGTSVFVSGEALGEMFGIAGDRLRVVLLNACYSAAQADAMLGSIDVVIGMSDAIGDRAARIFSAAFYRALGFGRNVTDAFDLGVNAMKLEGFPRDAALPVLQTRAGVDAATVVIAAPPRPPRRLSIAVLVGLVVIALAGLTARCSMRRGNLAEVDVDYVRLDDTQLAALDNPDDASRPVALQRVTLASFTDDAVGAKPAGAAAFRAIAAASARDAAHDQEYTLLRLRNSGSRPIAKLEVSVAEFGAPVLLRNIEPHDAVALPARVAGRHADLARWQTLTFTHARALVGDEWLNIELPPLSSVAFRRGVDGVMRAAPP